MTQAALTVIRSSATGNANVTAAVTTLMSEANTLQAKLADVAVSLSSLWNAGFGSSVGLLETARYEYHCVWAGAGVVVTSTISLKALGCDSLLHPGGSCPDHHTAGCTTKKASIYSSVSDFMCPDTTHSIPPLH